jgi:hypothetical protein
MGMWRINSNPDPHRGCYKKHNCCDRSEGACYPFASVSNIVILRLRLKAVITGHDGMFTPPGGSRLLKTKKCKLPQVTNVK